MLLLFFDEHDNNNNNNNYFVYKGKKTKKNKKIQLRSLNRRHVQEVFHVGCLVNNEVLKHCTTLRLL